MNRLLCGLLICVAFISGRFCAEPDEPKYRVYVQAKDSSGPSLVARLVRKGLDAVYKAEDGAVEVVANNGDLLMIKMSRMGYHVIENAEPLEFKLAKGTLPTGYHDLESINQILSETAQKYSHIAKLIDVGAEYGVGSTHEGRSIYALKISDNVDVDEDEPNILFVALHHAREIVTPEIVLELIRRLTENYETDTGIQNYVDNNEIFLAPVWNPDGLEYVWKSNNMWRKNRRQVSGLGAGIDLNRNYELGWDGMCSGNILPSSDTFRGPSANSEQETKNMVQFSRKRNFAKVIDFHSPGRNVLVSYSCETIPHVVDDYISSEGAKLAGLVGYESRAPSTDGGHQQFSIKELTNYAFLVETETEFQPSYQRALAEADRIWPLAQAVISKTIPLTGRITDVETGQPIVARIDVREVMWSKGESRYSNAMFGRYNVFLPDGKYTFIFSAPGYEATVASISLNNTLTTTHDIALTRK